MEIRKHSTLLNGSRVDLRVLAVKNREVNKKWSPVLQDTELCEQNVRKDKEHTSRCTLLVEQLQSRRFEVNAQAIITKMIGQPKWLEHVQHSYCLPSLRLSMVRLYREKW